MYTADDHNIHSVDEVYSSTLFSVERLFTLLYSYALYQNQIFIAPSLTSEPGPQEQTFFELT